MLSHILVGLVCLTVGFLIGKYGFKGAVAKAEQEVTDLKNKT